MSFELYPRLDQLRQRLDERGLRVERRRALEIEPERFRFVAEQEIDLVERLDVIGDERNRNRQHIGAAGRREQAQHFVRRWLEPARFSGAALKRQAPRMLAAEAREHAGDRALEILDVRIALLDERLRQ